MLNIDEEDLPGLLCPPQLAATLLKARPQTWQGLMLAADKIIAAQPEDNAPIDSLKSLVRRAKAFRFASSDLDNISCGACYHAILRTPVQKPLTLGAVQAAFVHGCALLNLTTKAHIDRFLTLEDGEVVFILSEKQRDNLTNETLPPALDEEAALSAIERTKPFLISLVGGADPNGKTAQKRKRMGLPTIPRQISPIWLANFRALVTEYQRAMTPLKLPCELIPEGAEAISVAAIGGEGYCMDMERQIGYLVPVGSARHLHLIHADGATTSIKALGPTTSAEVVMLDRQATEAFIKKNKAQPLTKAPAL